MAQYIGRFLRRSQDRLCMILLCSDGIERRVDPFVGCVVLPNDYDPYSDYAAEYIKDTDYQLKEDELLEGEWIVEGKHHGQTILPDSITPHITNGGTK
jgi:hypothetical protein